MDYIYILIPGEGICLVTKIELSRLCAAGRQVYRLRILKLEEDAEPMGNERKMT